MRGNSSLIQQFRYSLDGTLKPMPVPFIPANSSAIRGPKGGSDNGGHHLQRPRSRSAHHHNVAAAATSSSSGASTQFSGVGSIGGGRLIK